MLQNLAEDILLQFELQQLLGCLAVCIAIFISTSVMSLSLVSYMGVKAAAHTRA